MVAKEEWLTVLNTHTIGGSLCRMLQDAVNDRFVIAHALGWFGKAMIFRDVWILHAVSFLFEMVEYSLVPWQPNFEECWWDHVRGSGAKSEAGAGTGAETDVRAQSEPEAAARIAMFARSMVRRIH